MQKLVGLLNGVWGMKDEPMPARTQRHMCTTASHHHPCPGPRNLRGPGPAPEAVALAQAKALLAPCPATSPPG